MTRQPGLFHPGFTPNSFDAALGRSFLEGQTVRQLGDGQWVVTSGSAANVSYLVGTRQCACKGHAMRGRCDHRARVCFETWMARQQPQSTPQSVA